MDQPTKRLYLSQADKMIMGVCGGLGEYFGIDSLVFRALFLLLSFGGGAGVLVYIVLAIITPRGPEVVGTSAYSHDQTKERINEMAGQMRQGAQNLAQEIRNTRGNGGRRSLVGLIIVIFGALLLLNQLYPQYDTYIHWNIFWPVAVILIGILILARRK